MAGVQYRIATTLTIVVVCGTQGGKGGVAMVDHEWE